MRKLLVIIAFLSIYVPLSAQFWEPMIPLYKINEYTEIDKTQYRFMYRLTYVKDVENPKQTYEDIQALDIAGNKMSKYYSWYLYEYVRNSKPQKGSVSGNPYRGSTGYEIFKNYPKDGVLTYTDIGYFNRPTAYIYEEPIPQFNWKIENGTVEMLGLHCQKATTSFRGRNYTAWFTMEIPISNGPWKFGGLPGLIMKIEDSEQHYVFECIGIENISEPIRFYDVKFNKVTRKELDQLYVRLHKDELRTLALIFHSVRGSNTTSSPILATPTSYERPYNPIERD